jgi:DNA-binding Lrp family transcriptional regulator
MTKSSRNQMDLDEKKVLSELMKNSKENIETIAQQCGFSRQKVWRMIKQLEASQKIWGYSAIVNPEKQGLQKFIMLFKQSPRVLDSKTADKANLDEIKKNYLELDITIETSHYLHGEYDWIIIFTAKDIRQAKKFMNLLNEKYPGLIEKVNLSQVLFTARDHCILNPSSSKVKDFI